MEPDWYEGQPRASTTQSPGLPSGHWCLVGPADHSEVECSFHSPSPIRRVSLYELPVFGVRGVMKGMCSWGEHIHKKDIQEVRKIVSLPLTWRTSLL